MNLSKMSVSSRISEAISKNFTNREDKTKSGVNLSEIAEKLVKRKFDSGNN